MKSENAELKCLVRGFPRSVVWFKDGQRLTADRHNDIENYQEDELHLFIVTRGYLFALHMTKPHGIKT
jgi:hypothetical protein